MINYQHLQTSNSGQVIATQLVTPSNGLEKESPPQNMSFISRLRNNRSFAQKIRVSDATGIIKFCPLWGKNEKKHTQTPRYREKKMQMQSEVSEPKKSKFGVFREIPKDVRLDRGSGKKIEKQNQRHLGVWGILVLGGWVCVFFLKVSLFWRGVGVVGLFWVDFFLKVVFSF